MLLITDKTESIAVTVAVWIFALFINSIAYADMQMRPDGPAPIGMMGYHAHKKGKLMLSYRYGRMKMDGNRSGSRDISADTVLESFPVSPLKMTMDMHMLGAMYGYKDRLTLMGMLPYLRKSMDLINRGGVRFSTRAQGVGDIKLMAIYKLYMSRQSDNQYSRLGVGFGLSLPTGDTNKRGNTPLGNIRLPYPMQLGSGTYDPILGVTYASFYPQWSWGVQFKTLQRIGKNNEGYRLGDEYHLSSWGAYRYSKYLSAAVRVFGKSWNNISGRDSQLNPAMVPTARTDLRSGERADLGVSINFLQPHGMFKNHRLAVEFLMPIYQHLTGPQPEADYAYTLGWQAAF